MSLKPIDKLSYTELRDEMMRLDKLLNKQFNYRGVTIAMMKTNIRKWRTEEAEGDYKNVVPMPAPSSKPALISKAPVKEKKVAVKEVKVKSGNTQHTVRAMGASGTLSADIIRLHEEGKTVTEIQATDPERFKYNTVFMIIKRYKIRQEKLKALQHGK